MPIEIILTDSGYVDSSKNCSSSTNSASVLYVLLSYNGVQGEKKLSKLEDSELEKQLKLLNKPTVKTIKVCILVYLN